MNLRLTAWLVAACLSAATLNLLTAQTVVFTNSFDGLMPPEIEPGVATLTGVQGYAGLGPEGNQFGGSFLRSPTGNTVTLTLSNLPPHASLTLAMLFAAIDSLDGTGTFPSGDFFTVTLDGNVIFRESFANAISSQIQSYEPPPGGELARHVDLGFSGPGGFYTDSAYNFAIDSRFSNLAHTNDVAVVTFLMEGPGVQPLEDESWAIDNLGVSVAMGGQPVITQLSPLGANMLISWSSVSNLSYRVQSKTNLSDSTWEDLDPQVNATNSVTQFLHPRSTGNRFYRIKVLP